ncbi:hypothetical protein ACFL6H_00660 [Candidatus Latescibacterota bacterium]
MKLNRHISNGFLIMSLLLFPNESFSEQDIITIIHNPVAVAQENEAITFNATITSANEILKVSVYYDFTGNRMFDNEIVMGLNGENEFQAILGPGVFLAFGMEYYIIAIDVNNNETRTPSDGFYSISANIHDVRSVLPVQGGFSMNDYRLISIPLKLPSKEIRSQMSGRLPEGPSGFDWRLFRFNSGSYTLNEYPDIEGFEPGKSFWLITVNNYSLTCSEGTTVSTAEPFSIELRPGWNYIANPWMFTISWNDIANPSAGNLSEIYTYEGLWSDPMNPQQKLEPWQGYVVNNLENRNVIIKLLPELFSVSKARSEVDQNEWKLTIKAQTGLAVDSANHLGVAESASKEWDENDHLEPPVIGNYISVSFPHQDWKQYPDDYTVDFRPPDKTISWDFNIRTNIPNETVNIDFENNKSLPEGCSFKVINCDNNHIVDLHNNSFNFVSGNNITERCFTLIVTTSL